jgi:hypothetical protein
VAVIPILRGASVRVGLAGNQSVTVHGVTDGADDRTVAVLVLCLNKVPARSIIGVHRLMPQRVGNSQHAVAGVVGEAAGIAQRVGLTEHIAPTVVGETPHVTPPVGQGSEVVVGVPAVTLDVSHCIPFREQSSVAIVGMHRRAPVGVGDGGLVGAVTEGDGVACRVGLGKQAVGCVVTVLPHVTPPVGQTGDVVVAVVAELQAMGVAIQRGEVYSRQPPVGVIGKRPVSVERGGDRRHPARHVVGEVQLAVGGVAQAGEAVTAIVGEGDGIAVRVGDAGAEPAGAVGIGEAVAYLLFGGEVVTADGAAVGNKGVVDACGRQVAAVGLTEEGVALAIAPMHGNVSRLGIHQQVEQIGV